MSVELYARAIGETDGALLVEIDNDKYWIPQSQIQDESEVYRKGHEGVFIISDWIAKQKGLHDD